MYNNKLPARQRNIAAVAAAVFATVATVSFVTFTAGQERTLVVARMQDQGLMMAKAAPAPQVRLATAASAPAPEAAPEIRVAKADKQ